MTTKPQPAALPKRRSYLAPALLLLVATLGMSRGDARAWAQGPDGYQAYPLRHARIEQVERALARLVPAGTEIVADRRGNRILIRGSAEAKHVAQRAIESLDAPPPTAAAPLPPAGTEAVLKVYPGPPGGAAGVAARLQEEFGRAPGVRIVTDERTSQVLVLAPPEIQSAVSARLGQTGQATPAAASQPARPSAMPAGESARFPDHSRQVQLRHATAASLESSLASVFGDRLMAAATQIPGAAAYRVRLSDGSDVGLLVDRAANSVAYTASGAAAGSVAQLIQALDSPMPAADQAMRLVPLKTTRAADARKTVDAIRITNASRDRSQSAGQAAATKGMPLAARMFQPGKRGDEQVAAAEAQPAPEAAPPAAPGAPGTAPPGAPARGDEAGGLIGPVQIELLDGLDVMVIRGNARDVRQVTELIQQIEKLSQETEPAIDVLQLQHADSLAVSTLVTQLYGQVFTTRQGTVTILPLIKPNALLVVGRKENVQRVQTMVKQLDVPVAPESQFQVFRLKHASPTNVQTMIDEFYADRGGGLAPVVRVTSDPRSNSLVVHASPRDLAEVSAMIARIDVKDSEAVNELRVFKLTNTVASDLAQTLNDAIQSQGIGQGQFGARTGVAGAARPATPGIAGTPGASAGMSTGQRSSMLQFVTVDPQGQRRLSSGILSDVRITFDLRANTVLVAAPAESMPLIEALVKQLDQPPAVRAEVKVFTVVNSDAAALVTMLNEFFGLSQTGTTGGAFGGGATGTAAGPNYQTAAQAGESSLVPLRFAADSRTNSIIASGIASDLLVVEAMLLRLDAGEVRNRISTVYRLKNAPANDVATAINNFLRSELQVTNVQTTGGSLLSPFEQIERQVVVVAEPVSNALIVASTPRYFEDIKKIVEDLDRRPPMVLIQCLIAEVALTNNDEFGVEFGLQDGLLFNRGAPPNPGFLFNTPTLGNDGTATALAQAAKVGTQGLTNFGVGRTTTNGFGGLVMQASSESVSVLIRALRARQRIDVLARPQVQTLDNQTAYINVGQSVAQIMGVTSTTFGQTNNIQYTNTGIIMGVTPRISPDGIVVMEIDATRSDLGPEAEGTPIFVSSTGQVIRAPRVNQTLAQTTVSASDGQTIVLGGLISRQVTNAHREVPYLADVPVLGHLFRFDTKESRKTELLIIMTPHVVRTDEDAEAVKRMEAARMHWCLADVIDMMGEESGLRTRRDDWPDNDTKVIYPDGDPRSQRSSSSPGKVPMPPAPLEASPSTDATPFRSEPPTAPDGKKSPTSRGTPRTGAAGVQAYYQQPTPPPQ